MSDGATEAMRRLGTVLLRCPSCKQRFAFTRVPRYWIHKYEQGNLGDVDDVYPGPDTQQDLTCSQRCAESFAEELNSNAPEDVTYTVYEDDCSPRDPY